MTATPGITTGSRIQSYVVQHNRTPTKLQAALAKYGHKGKAATSHVRPRRMPSKNEVEEDNSAQRMPIARERSRAKAAPPTGFVMKFAGLLAPLISVTLSLLASL